jgi:hypothetical protein
VAAAELRLHEHQPEDEAYPEGVCGAISFKLEAGKVMNDGESAERKPLVTLILLG